MTRTNSRRWEAGRLFILSVTDDLDHVSKRRHSRMQGIILETTEGSTRSEPCQASLGCPGGHLILSEALEAPNRPSILDLRGLSKE
jgi:hypothetical protein